MATSDFKLAAPPAGERARELWLQHAAGFIIFEDARKYAIDRIGANVDEGTRSRVIAGINDAIYGLMMIADGVSGRLQSERHAVTLETRVRLHEKQSGATIEDLALSDGDGMCMGYHGWLESDYGSDAIASPQPENA